METTKKQRVLILTPWAPYPMPGACQQDRFFGMKFMKELGHDVKVIGRYHDFQDKAALQAVFDHEGVDMTLVPHMKQAWKLLLKKPWLPFLNFGWLDGAALEFADPAYIAVVKKMIEEFKPTVAWLEYCSHWPMADIFHSYGIPVILKSSNNEAAQCMDDHDRSITSILKAMPKYVSEWMVSKKSDAVLAVSPNEEVWYKKLGAKYATTLPLRGLSQCLVERTHRDKEVLDVVYLTSNYNMGHNRVIVEFVLRDVIPLVRKAMPGKYRFHITGRKFPKEFEKYLAEDVISVGFVPDISVFLSRMDIALSPWITGQGMQQKVFEPLCRSIPTMTTKTGGYPFEKDTEVLLCSTPEEYVEGFKRFLSTAERNRISAAGYQKAHSLFSTETLKGIMEDTIKRVTKG